MQSVVMLNVIMLRVVMPNALLVKVPSGVNFTNVLFCEDSLAFNFYFTDSCVDFCSILVGINFCTNWPNFVFYAKFCLLQKALKKRLPKM